MAIDPESQTQLARLLHDESLRHASIERVRQSVDAAFDLLVDGLVAEAAASDDVFDHDSAISFVRLRVDALESVISEPQASRLFAQIQAKIEAW
jgi:hypothetical protein